jgi:plastocyanin
MLLRTPIALAAVAALAVGTPALAAAPKPKPNTIETQGAAKIKINEYLQDGQKFVPGDITVKSGATVTLRNKSTDGAPHSLSLLAKSALPKTVAAVMQCPACGPLLAAHQADPNTGEVKVPLVDVGQPGFDTMGTKTTAGDSIFLPPKGKVTFKVTAKKGTKLTYFCAVHPWMQGTITVK